MVRVTKPRLLSQQTAKSTKRRRSAELTGIRDVVNGGPGARKVKLEEEEEEKKPLISTENALILKSQLGLPWNKLREMRRYYSI